MHKWIQKGCCRVMSLLQNGPLVLAGLAGISALSLIMALIAQYGFDMRPCILCIYQRWPFAAVILIAGLVFLFARNSVKGINAGIALSGIALAINAGIAFYHTGVEQKWWKGFSGCSTPDLSGSVEDLMKRIKNAPLVRCDEIPWADPVFGISMAGYNTLLCAGLAVVCVISLYLRHGRISRNQISSSSVSQ